MSSLESSIPLVEMSISKSLQRAIIRLQAAEDLEWEEACVKAAELIDSNREKFKQAVNSAANRIYKSRFMTEINKAKDTWHTKGYNEGFNDGETVGRAEGLKEGKKEYQIWYYCNICSKRINVKPYSKSHLAIMKMMRQAGWGHAPCHAKAKS